MVCRASCTTLRARVYSSLDESTFLPPMSIRPIYLSNKRARLYTEEHSFPRDAGPDCSSAVYRGDASYCLRLPGLIGGRAPALHKGQVSGSYVSMCSDSRAWYGY